MSRLDKINFLLDWFAVEVYRTFRNEKLSVYLGEQFEGYLWVMDDDEFEKLYNYARRKR